MSTPSTGSERPVPPTTDSTATGSRVTTSEEPRPAVREEQDWGMTGNTSHRPEEFNPDDFE
ncbi:MAG TPA: hypothetical protein VHJ17_18835 [Thermomonospora sp.]|nr:hypothetical protein [Thermomonospora sp.]